MIVFNLAAILEALIALIPGVAVAGLGLAVDSTSLFALGISTFFAAALAVDGLWRLPKPEDRTVGGWLWGMLWPSSGGHVMFLPVWLVGLAGSLFFGFGAISVLFS